MLAAFLQPRLGGSSGIIGLGVARRFLTVDAFRLQPSLHQAVYHLYLVKRRLEETVTKGVMPPVSFSKRLFSRDVVRGFCGGGLAGQRLSKEARS